jgi:iron complex outermembrane receptor protein
MKKYRALLLASAVATGTGIALPVCADEPDQLETVTVTAQKRSEDIQKVPFQVTALSSEQLASADVRNTQQALNLVPNVNMAHSYTFLNSFVTIRGISEINNADPPMAVVVDGVPQNNQKQLSMDLFDVQQVEVLMGPQGGLYGRNAIGGAMIVTTEKPTNEYKGLVDVSYGNGNSYQTMGSVSGPIIDDKLLFSVAGNVQGSGGLIKNPYLDENVDAVNHDDTGRLRLIAYPTSWLTLDLRGDYNDFKGGATWDSVVFSGNPNDIQPPVSDYRGATTGHVADATFKFDADLGFATLTGITGYTNLTEDNRGSLDFTNPIVNPGGLFGLYGPVGQGQNLTTSMTSQELRLVSPDTQSFRWIIGSYYVYTNRWLLTRAFLEIPTGSDQFDNPGLTIIDRNEHDHDYASAFYGQVDYDITHSLTLTGAFRYDTDRIEQTNEALPGLGETVRADESAPEPKATLTYHFDGNALAYATYSTGFRAGGFNSPNIASPYTEYFMPEKVTNYEVGFKTSWLDQALIVNGAYYYAIDRNFQFFFVNASNGSQIIQNLDRVHINGVELNVQAIVAHGLKFFGGLGTTNTDIVESSEFPSVVGNKTPKTIPWSTKVGFQYDRSLGSAMNGTVRVDYTHNAREYWQIDNLDIQKSLNLVNARAGIELREWGVYLWSKNLTNERYYEDYNPSKYSGLPYDIGSLAEPRTYGVEFRAHF